MIGNNIKRDVTLKTMPYRTLSPGTVSSSGFSKPNLTINILRIDLIHARTQTFPPNIHFLFKKVGPIRITSNSKETLGNRRREEKGSIKTVRHKIEGVIMYRKCGKVLIACMACGVETVELTEQQ